MKKSITCNTVKASLLLAIVMFVCLFPALQSMAAEPTATTTTEPDYPIYVRIDVSPLPLPGEETVITFTVDIERMWKDSWYMVGATSDTLAHSRAWIEVYHSVLDGKYSEFWQYTQLPLEEIITEGNTSWEGDARQPMTIELKSTMRLPSEGRWCIKGYFTGENWSRTLDTQRKFIVADGYTVPDYRADLVYSPLAYLTDLEYDYFMPPPDEQCPVYLELDMDHPPLAGEPVSVTFKIFSPFYDVQDFKLECQFRRWGNSQGIKVHPTTIITTSEERWEIDGFGDAYWQRDLHMDETVDISNTMIFPDPGRWQIEISGDYEIPGLDRPQNRHSKIKVTITEDNAYYGWNEYNRTSIPVPTASNTSQLPDDLQPITLAIKMMDPSAESGDFMTVIKACSPSFDIENFKVELQFGRYKDTRWRQWPATDMVRKSEPTWQHEEHGKVAWTFSLEKGETIEIHPDLSFREPGEWYIYVYGTCFVPDLGFIKASDIIVLFEPEDWKTSRSWCYRPETGWEYRQVTPATDITEAESTTSDVNPTSSTSGNTTNTVWWWVGGGVLVVTGILAVVLLKKRNQ